MKAGDFRTKRASRNKALAFFLLGLAVLFFAITVVKMGGAGA